MIVGLFRRSAKGFGFVRPHTLDRQDRPDLYPARGHARRLERRRSRRQDHQAVAARGDERRRAGSSRCWRGPRASSSGPTSRPATPASSRSTARRSASRSRWAIPGPRGPGPATRSRSRSSATRRPISRARGSSIEILGQRGQPGVDTLTVIRAFNIPDTFDEDVLEEAREQAKLFDEAEIGTRLDLRALPTVTIDPATARDFDDAISLSRDEQGHWSLAVHIADVSHFVRPGSRARPRRPGTAARASICPTA